MTGSLFYSLARKNTELRVEGVIVGGTDGVARGMCELQFDVVMVVAIFVQDR